jgi:Uncharacterized protein family UPF0004
MGPTRQSSKGWIVASFWIAAATMWPRDDGCRDFSAACYALLATRQARLGARIALDGGLRGVMLAPGVNKRARRHEFMSKRVFIKTYGCQMNVYDSARIEDVLAGMGYAPVSDPAGADMVVLNTCHIREKAAEKVYSELGRLRALKDARAAEGGRMILAVAGCVAQAEGAEMRLRAPAVDLVLGPQTYHRLPEMLARLEKGEGVVEADFPT